MYAIDEQMGLLLNEGKSAESLYKEAYRTFWNETPEGQRLPRTPEVILRLNEVFAERFETEQPYPDVPFVFRWQQAAQDLLNAEISESVPEQQTEVPVQLTEEEEIEALAQQFRDDINDPNVTAAAIRQRRESSVKHRKAWNLVNAPDAAPVSRSLPNNETIKFAHMLNEEIQERGVPKPRAGFYHVLGYRYGVAEYRRLSDLAAQFDLIK